MYITPKQKQQHTHTHAPPPPPRTHEHMLDLINMCVIRVLMRTTAVRYSGIWTFVKTVMQLDVKCVRILKTNRQE